MQRTILLAIILLGLAAPPSWTQDPIANPAVSPPAPPVAGKIDSPATEAVDAELLKQELTKFIGHWKLVQASEEKHIPHDGEDTLTEYVEEGDHLVMKYSYKGTSGNLRVTLDLSNPPERGRHLVYTENYPGRQLQTSHGIYQFFQDNPESNSPLRLKIGFSDRHPGKSPVSMEEEGIKITVYEKVPANQVPDRRTFRIAHGQITISLMNNHQQALAWTSDNREEIPLVLDRTVRVEPAVVSRSRIGVVQQGALYHAFSQAHRKWVPLKLPEPEIGFPNVREDKIEVTSPSKGKFTFTNESGKWMTEAELKAETVAKLLNVLKEHDAPAAEAAVVSTTSRPSAVDVDKSPAVLASDSMANEAAKLIVQLEDERVKLLQNLGDKHPKIEELDARLAQARSQITLNPEPPEADSKESLQKEMEQAIEYLEMVTESDSPIYNEAKNKMAEILASYDQTPAKAKIKGLKLITQVEAEALPLLEAGLEKLKSRRSVQSPESLKDYEAHLAYCTDKVAKLKQRVIAQLRKDYDAAEAEAQRLAEQLRQPGSTASKDKLRKTVERAFTLRQSLLRAELSEMLDRLAKTQHSIDLRDRITDQIVTRRVEELLNPQLEWDESKSGTQPETPSAPPKESAPSQPQAWTTKLQGHWQLMQHTYEQVDTSDGKKPQPGDIKRENWNPETYYRKQTTPWKAMFDGHQMSICKEDGSDPMTFELTFCKAGPPQQVDLTMVLNEEQIAEFKRNAEESQSPMEIPAFTCIIEETPDGFRMCLDMKVTGTRPFLFVLGPDTGLWEFRREATGEPNKSPPPAATTELEGDWNLVWMETRDGRSRSPVNMTIRGNRNVITRQNCETSGDITVDAKEKSILFASQITSPTQGGQAPPIPSGSRGTYEIVGDRLTIHSKQDQQTYVWTRGLRDLQSARRIPEGMKSFGISGDASATRQGQLFPGDKVDITAEWRKFDGTSMKGVVAERVEVENTAISHGDAFHQTQHYVGLLVSAEQEQLLQNRRLRNILAVSIRKPDDDSLQYPNGVNTSVIAEIKAAAGANPMTPLEGDWYLYSEESGGNVTGQRMSLSIRGDEWTRENTHTKYKNVTEKLQGRLLVDLDKYSFWLSKWPEEQRESNAYVVREFQRGCSGTYEVNGDTLKLKCRDSNETNFTMTWKRGHRDVVLPLSPASDSQRLRWRSGIVEIFLGGNDSLGKRLDGVDKGDGMGLVVSPDGLIVGIPRNSAFYFANSDTHKLHAKFDDGSFVKLTVVEDAKNGWLAFKPEKEMRVNHFFPIATTPNAIADEVYAWGTNISGAEHFPDVFQSKILLMDRRLSGTSEPVWQLLKPDHWGRASGLPILSAEGELLALTMPDTGDLLLALPADRLKAMFPKSFSPPAEAPTAPAKEEKPAPAP